MLNKTLKLFTLGHRNAPGKDTGAVHDLPMIYPGFCRISGSSRSPMTIQARNWRFAIDYIDSPRYFLITTGCWHWEFPEFSRNQGRRSPKIQPINRVFSSWFCKYTARSRDSELLAMAGKHFDAEDLRLANGRHWQLWGRTSMGAVFDSHGESLLG